MTIAVGLIYSPSQCFLHAIQKMAQLTETNANAPSLLRELGVTQASAIVVGTIIGSGIFLVPAEMMQAVGSARLVYLAWIVGGVLSMAGAITYAELGAMKPQDRKSTRLNSSHLGISYAVFCLKK